MTRKKRRLVLIGSALTVLAVAVALVLTALKDAIVFFNSPTDVAEKHIATGSRIRLGGLVKEGSVERGDNLQVRFEVTDGKNSIRVAYQGLLPDLFREGQGIVTEGTLEGSGLFKADSVLAKHDEKYMPKEVADALKKQGHWKEDGGKDGGKSAATEPKGRTQ
jgi:cytochrome c-type biogenesis protein CcmE